MPGLDGPRVFTIRSLDEAIGLRQLLDRGAIRHAVVVGAGYIGLEAAEALVGAGAEVEIIEALPRVLGNVDEPIARGGPGRAGAAHQGPAGHPAGRGADDGDGGLTAVLGGEEIGTDLVVVATGVRPMTDLLVQAGAEHLPDRSLLVDAQHAHLAAGRVRGR